MHCISFAAGEHINKAAELLVAAAREHGSASATFNDIPLSATRTSTAAEIVKYYADETKRRHAEWRSSPAGLAAERQRNNERAAAQAKHDDLMRRLPSLDMRDEEDVLDWLCAMQGPSDHIGVIVRRDTILSRFRAAGYEPNENVGKDFRAEDRTNVFRWLVGQALDCLSTGPAIHGIIHKFADEWRAKFVRKPEMALTSGMGDEQ